MSVVTMLASPLRCYKNMKIVNQGILALGNGHSYGPGKAYSKDKGTGCCKDVNQTDGRKVEPWPKPDPPPQAWRCECPKDPQPPNYDPYRIKVPDVVVPPLPPSNAKAIPDEDSRGLFRNPEIQHSEPGHGIQDLFHNSQIVHPDYWKDKPERKLSNVEEPKETMPKLGYHGRSKYKFAFHEPWKPLDRMSLLEQAAKQELDLVEEKATAIKTEK